MTLLPISPGATLAASCTGPNARLRPLDPSSTTSVIAALPSPKVSFATGRVSAQGQGAASGDDECSRLHAASINCCATQALIGIHNPAAKQVTPAANAAIEATCNIESTRLVAAMLTRTGA